MVIVQQLLTLTDQVSHGSLIVATHGHMENQVGNTAVIANLYPSNFKDMDTFYTKADRCRVFSARHFSLFVFVIFLVSSCGKTNEKPGYLKEIPNVNSLEYFSIQDWNGIKSRSVKGEEWYNATKDSLTIGMVADIIKIHKNQFWISDVISGRVIALDSTGTTQNYVFKKGKGPQEFLRPTAMSVFRSGSGENFIYIMDSHLKFISQIEVSGKERNRFYIKDIPNALASKKFTVWDENTFVWPNHKKEFVLAEWDTSGIQKRKMVQAIIPKGYHPTMHNNVTYTFNKLGELYYCYQGLPLIFTKTQQKEYVINLLPDKEIEQLNTSLKLRPLSEQVTVKGLCRNIFIAPNRIVVNYLNELYVIPDSKDKSIIKYTVFDANNTKINFTFSFRADDNLYLANSRKGIIYKININKLQVV